MRARTNAVFTMRVDYECDSLRRNAPGAEQALEADMRGGVSRGRRAVQGTINPPCRRPPRLKNAERSVGDRFDEEQAEFQASGQNRANDDLPAHEERFHHCTSGWTTGARTVPRLSRSQMT